LWQVAADLCEVELEDVGAVAKNLLSPEPVLRGPTAERGGGAGPRGEGERISSEQFSLCAADSQDER